MEGRRCGNGVNSCRHSTNAITVNHRKFTGLGVDIGEMSEILTLLRLGQGRDDPSTQVLGQAKRGNPVLRTIDGWRQ